MTLGYLEPILVVMIVLPLLARFLSVRTSWKALVASRPVVGSLHPLVSEHVQTANRAHTQETEQTDLKATRTGALVWIGCRTA